MRPSNEGTVNRGWWKPYAGEVVHEEGRLPEWHVHRAAATDGVTSNFPNGDWDLTASSLK